MTFSNSHIQAAILNGGQLLVKHVPGARTKCFHAMISFSDGTGTLGAPELSMDAALNNLENRLIRESGLPPEVK